MNNAVKSVCAILESLNGKPKIVGEYAFQKAIGIDDNADVAPLRYDITTVYDVRTLAHVFEEEIRYAKVLRVTDRSIDVQLRDTVITIWNNFTTPTLNIFNIEYNTELKKHNWDGKAQIELKENTQEFISKNPVAILDAIRCAIKYKLYIGSETSELIHNNIDLISKINIIERTKQMKDMLCCNKPVKNILSQYSDVVSALIPEIEPCIKFNQNSTYHCHDVYGHMLYVTDYCNTNKFEIKLAALLHDIGKPSKYTEDTNGFGHFTGHPIESHNICKTVLKYRFRLTRQETEHISNLVLEHDYKLNASHSSVRRFISKYGYTFLDDWMILKQADIDDHINLSPKIINMPLLHSIYLEIIESENKMSLRKLKISGKDIMKITGERPGRTIGIILNELLVKVENMEIDNEYLSLVEETLKIYDGITK